EFYYIAYFSGILASYMLACCPVGSVVARRARNCVFSEISRAMVCGRVTREGWLDSWVHRLFLILVNP
ncbi:MAG: hypothetical protein ACPHL6_09240, partial [Rubripirellula sp.]